MEKRMANVPLTKDDIALALFFLGMAEHAEVGEGIKKRYVETVEHIRQGVLEAARQLDKAEGLYDTTSGCISQSEGGLK